MIDTAPLIAAVVSLALGGISLLWPPRRLRHATFAAGMVAFALESALVYALLVRRYWQHARCRLETIVFDLPCFALSLLSKLSSTLELRLRGSKNSFQNHGRRKPRHS